MDASIIVPILFGLAVLVMIVLVIVRLARKKPELPSAEEGERPELPAPEPARREARREEKPVPGRRPEVPGKRVEVPGKKVEAPVPTPEAPKVLTFPMPAAKPLGHAVERTRKEGFIARLREVFQKEQIDDALVAQAEEALLTADIGVRTAGELIQALRTDFQPSGGDLAPQVMGFLRDRALDMLSGLPHGAPQFHGVQGPAVLMVVGVNGTGKTTTIGKMANLYAKQGKRVLLAAGDTYRAAGMDQLVIWGERVGVPVVAGKPNQDPASVFFDAAKQAVADNVDLLIADTAGRLHTNVNLVDELKKVARVLGKAIPGAPHEVLLVLDATMGQNAVRQADIFRQAVNVTGISLAKLDGTAKGGVVLSIARDMNLPIRFVGVGEAIDDLRSFDPAEFADALFAVE